MFTKEQVSQACDLLYSFLRNGEITHSKILESAPVFAQMIVPDDKDFLDAVVNQFEEETNLKTFEPDVLTDGGYDNRWMEDKETDRAFFNRYRRYLIGDGMNKNIIDRIEDSCQDILSYCADPNNETDSEHFKKKGLVIGEVQSGKTANYTALINLACDYGYQFILLLTGMNNLLRKQTQERIDAGFVGAESSSIASDDIRFIGVGSSAKKYFVIPLTNTENDFKQSVKVNTNMQLTDVNKQVVMVVKKNVSVLKQIQSWVKAENKNVQLRNILIIDDEADYASLNTKKDDLNPTAINKQIRTIYNNFNVASYVGFTATPFANIFINPFDDISYKDLFPSNFILQLNAPENYFGTRVVFGQNQQHLRILDEGEKSFLPVKHKKDQFYLGLPESLKEAILEFLIGNVLRTLRGDEKKHRSMMVNISRFNDVHSQIYKNVERYLETVKNIINQDSYKEEQDFISNEEMKKLYDLYQGEFYQEIRTEVSFAQIKEGLSVEVNQVVVSLVNNKVKDRIDYKTYEEVGVRVIVVGGLVLSRGLTLEGLMTSYFSRNAGAYDTMLQMGRWFGYRMGYQDLCRVYLSQINIDNFLAVDDAVVDLRTQLKQMTIRGKTPEEFGLMVKESPDTLETNLLVTSRNKMHHTTVVETYLNYGGMYTDTSKISKRPQDNKHNISTTQNFVETLHVNGRCIQSVGDRKMICDVDKTAIANLIESVKISPVNMKFNTNSLSYFID